MSNLHYAHTEKNQNYANDSIANQGELSKKELFKVAEEELRETENSRKECLRQLKHWIEQNDDIRNCIMGKLAQKPSIREFYKGSWHNSPVNPWHPSL